MKLTKYIVLISAFLFVVNIFSCKDRNESDCHAPQEFLDYWFFPEGSWWVYTINDTIIDSLTNRNYITTDNEDSDPCDKHYSSYFTHYTSDSLQYYIGEHSYFSFNLGIDNWILQLRSGNNNYWGIGTFYKHNAEIGDIIKSFTGKNDSFFMIVHDTNSIITQAGEFNQTIHIKKFWYYHTKEVPGFAITDIWLTKNVGITKLRYYDSTEIELLRYHINK